MSIWLIAMIVLVSLALIWLIYLLFWGTPPNIHWAVERLGLRMILADPELLTTLGILDNTPLDFHSGKLTDSSPQYMAQQRSLDRYGLALMQRYHPEKLTGQERITYRLMRWYFEQNLRGHRFSYHWVTNPVFMGPYPVNHIFGVQVDLIQFLCTYHKVENRFSARRYLKRLRNVDWKLAGLTESMAEREADGVVPPSFVLEKCLEQIHSYLEGSLEENPLYTSFLEKVQQSGRFSEAAAQRWGDKVLRVLSEHVVPAYQRLEGALNELLPNAGIEDGVWRLPNGRAYYDFLLETHTTIGIQAEEIHQLGLAEVEKLTESIQSVLRNLGLPDDNPGKRLQALMKDPSYHFNDEDAREDILQTYQSILDEVNQRVPEVFNHGALEKIVAKRLPEYKEPDSPIAYAQAPSMDGSRPGMMWVNLRDPDNIYRWGMRTLAYHEGIPGHVYQMAQAQSIRGLPTFRRAYFFNAYTEGWALYAEHLAWELGLEDDLSNLGRLQALIWRAARLVVDTGIHDKQWTREQAIVYMVEKTGLPERDVTTEVERYIVMPGQACAYYLGYLRMLDLRKKAESALGEAFDLRDFHDVIINNGSLPLPLLADVVNEYVDQQAGLISRG